MRCAQYAKWLRLEQTVSAPSYTCYVDAVFHVKFIIYRMEKHQIQVVVAHLISMFKTSLWCLCVWVCVWLAWRPIQKAAWLFVDWLIEFEFRCYRVVLLSPTIFLFFSDKEKHIFHVTLFVTRSRDEKTWMNSAGYVWPQTHCDDLTDQLAKTNQEREGHIWRVCDFEWYLLRVESIRTEYTCEWRNCFFFPIFLFFLVRNWERERNTKKK